MLNFKQLNMSNVQRNLEIHKQLVKEHNPDIEVGRGVFHDLVLYYSSIFATANQQAIQETLRTINLSKLLKDPQSAQYTLVDKVLDNWMIKRKSGSTAKGTITCILDAAIPLVVPKGHMFFANNCWFKTTETYVIRTTDDGATMLANDKLLEKSGKSQWLFTLPVIAVKAGLSGNIRRGTHLRTETQLTPRIKRIIASSDFIGGADEETNVQMVQRLKNGIAGKVISNRATTEALIVNNEKFERISGLSIIGFGDAEMHRDRRTLWPGSIGGRCDIYLRQPGTVLTREVELNGKYLSASTWLIKVPADIVPGFYDCTVTKDGVDCKIIEDIRSFERNNKNDPDITVSIDAVYSKYQTTDLRVEAPVDNNNTFLVTFQYVDGIKEIQDYLTQRHISNPASDILVRAAVPCFVNLTMELWRKDSDIQCSISTIKDEIDRMINSLGFVGKLSAASIISILTPQLFGSTVIRKILLSGIIRSPSGQKYELASDTLLSIPNIPDQLVTPRTTAFYIDQNSIDIKITTID